MRVEVGRIEAELLLPLWIFERVFAMKIELQIEPIQIEPIVTERVAVIVWKIAQGQVYTTAEIAVICGLTWDGAYKLMCRVSRVLPIYLDNAQWKSID